MQMTNEEICRDFQQSKNKANQIKILAQLNLCKADEIIRILQDGGIQVGSLTKGTLMQKEILDKLEEPPFDSLTETIPETVPANWKNALKALTEHITELKQIRDNAEKELSEIYQTLGALCGKE